jgi:hypothetical protein
VSPGQVFAVGAYFVLAIAIVVALAKAREGSNARASSPGLGSGVARAEAAGPIDVWPPLLANSVGRVLLILVSLGLGHAIDLSFLAVGAPAHILFTGALIARFAWLRRPAGDAGAGAPPVRLTALAQIAICCGGEALTAGLGVPFALDGAWLIVIVATAMRVAGAARPL